MRKLNQSTNTGISQQAVWDVLKDFGGVEDWAPGMKRSALVGELESGVGTRRAMRHRLGFRIVEIVTDWTEGESYAFDLLRAPFPMRDVHETWNLETRDGQTHIRTTVSYNMRLGVIGAVLDTLLVRFLVNREMRLGLRALIHHVERISVADKKAQTFPADPVLEANTERQVSG